MLNGRTFPILLCDDPKAAAAFYLGLGYTLNADLGWFVSLDLRGDRATSELALCQAGHAWLPAEVRTWPAGAALLMLEVTDAEVSARQLAALGAALLTDPVDEPWGQRHFFVRAPDGAVLNVNAHCAPDPVWMKANGFA